MPQPVSLKFRKKKKRLRCLCRAKSISFPKEWKPGCNRRRRKRSVYLDFIFHLLRSLWRATRKKRIIATATRRVARLKSATTVPINRPPPSPTPKWLHTREFAMTAATNRGLRIPLCHISRHLQASLSSPTACHSQNRKPLIPRNVAEIDSFHVVSVSSEYEPTFEQRFI